MLSREQLGLSWPRRGGAAARRCPGGHHHDLLQDRTLSAQAWVEPLCNGCDLRFCVLLAVVEGPGCGGWEVADGEATATSRLLRVISCVWPVAAKEGFLGFSRPEVCQI